MISFHNEHMNIYIIREHDSTFELPGQPFLHNQMYWDKACAIRLEKWGTSIPLSTVWSTPVSYMFDTEFRKWAKCL